MGDTHHRSAEPESELPIRFDLSVWKRGAERAPHKPLLLLLALARLQQGASRLVSYEEVEPKLSQLLMDFGPARKSYHPEYPFWYLQNDGFWELPNKDQLEAAVAHRKRSKDIPPGILKQLGAQGGFVPTVHEYLSRHPEQVHDLAARLLEEHFPSTLHEDILDAVGFQWQVLTGRRSRDPAFREHILRIYDHRCALCGYDGRLGHSDLALEAAHVRWHSHAGPDQPDNGIALCTFHHKTFDRGAYTLAPEGIILVSQEVHGSQHVDEWLIRYHGRAIRKPQSGQPTPHAEHVLWHQRQVFHGPARRPAVG